MNLDALTLDQPCPDSYPQIRDVLEQAFSETLTRMAGGQGLEHFLLHRLRGRAGDSNKEIARSLNLSLHTVKRHVANIFNKLGVESRVQAASFLHARH